MRPLQLGLEVLVEKLLISRDVFRLLRPECGCVHIGQWCICTSNQHIALSIAQGRLHDTRALDTRALLRVLEDKAVEEVHQGIQS